MNNFNHKQNYLSDNISAAFKSVYETGHYNFYQFFYGKNKYEYLTFTPYNVILNEMIRFYNLDKLDYLSSVDTIKQIQIFILMELAKCKINENNMPF